MKHERSRKKVRRKLLQFSTVRTETGASAEALEGFGLQLWDLLMS